MFTSATSAIGTVRSWNPGAVQLHGWTEREMYKGPIDILLPPKRDAERQQISEALLAGQSVEIAETTRLRQDGSRIAVSISFSPVRDASGQIIGAFTIARSITAQKLARQAEAQAQATIRRQAEHDSRTDLPNRAHFYAALSEALSQGEPLAVPFVDLDMFKRVNDSLGHAAGDHLLREVAAEELTVFYQPQVSLRTGRVLGMRVAVDDFGTGYSSLAYLRRFPLDILKVERSFISGLAETGAEGRRNRAVFHTGVDMAHALSLEMIAEGIETEEQRTIMAALGGKEVLARSEAARGKGPCVLTAA